MKGRNMQPYQERVVIEKTELDEKCSKLSSFINSETYYTLNSLEQLQLAWQLKFMTLYSDILGERIAGFKLHELI